MTILEFLVLLLVAGIAGALAQAIAGYTRGGCLVSIALGFIGALLGSWIGSILGLPGILSIYIGSRAFPLDWAIVGATIFGAIVGWFSKRRPHHA